MERKPFLYRVIQHLSAPLATRVWATYLKVVAASLWTKPWWIPLPRRSRSVAKERQQLTIWFRRLSAWQSSSRIKFGIRTYIITIIFSKNSYRFQSSIGLDRGQHWNGKPGPIYWWWLPSLGRHETREWFLVGGTSIAARWKHNRLERSISIYILYLPTIISILQAVWSLLPTEFW